MGEELFGPASELDVQETVVGLLDLGVSEGAQAELDHGAVVQDLGCSIGMGHGVLRRREKNKFLGSIGLVYKEKSKKLSC